MTQRINKLPIMTRLVPELKARAEAEAKRQNRSVSNLIEFALSDYLERVAAGQSNQEKDAE